MHQFVDGELLEAVPGRRRRQAAAPRSPPGLGPGDGERCGAASVEELRRKRTSDALFTLDGYGAQLAST